MDFTKKYPTTVGIETTWLKPHKRNWTRQRDACYCWDSEVGPNHDPLKCHRGKWVEDYDTLSDLVNKDFKDTKLKSHNVGPDGDCLEIASPVFHTRVKMEAWWLASKAIVDKYNMVATKPREMSGGCHIHLGLDGFAETTARTSFLFNMIRDLYNRPYLNWVFNEPFDYENANWVGRTWQRSFNRRIPVGNPSRNEWGELHYTRYETMFQELADNLPTGKDWAFRLDTYTNTVELRFFDMPWSLAEQHLHIDFAMAYFSWIKEMTQNGYRIETSRKLRSQRAVAKITYAQALEGFQELIRTLDLRYADYEVFVKRNLKKRYTLEPKSKFLA